MSKKILYDYYKELSSLVFFRNLLKDKVISAYKKLLKNPSSENYAKFLNKLFCYGGNLTNYVINLIYEDENCFLLRKAQGDEVSPQIQVAVQAELKFLEKIATISPKIIREAIGDDADFVYSDFETSKLDFTDLYFQHIQNLHKRGYGIFAKYKAFTVKNSELIPVKNPDEQTLETLSGYELQISKVVDNTVALLDGKPAANILLYGDAGTGKSSTVKAVANKFAKDGLRIVELSKNDLVELPNIIEKIAKNPLKFIVFIDDISFTSSDDNFGRLKAILEGSISTKANNVVIYATSNRRNLVKENFSDRDGDDIHASDTREETASLAERFGLRVAFLKPNKAEYLQIVEAIACEYGIKVDENLFLQAEAYALRRNGRSGRAAKHFVEITAAKSI